jgi:hypothetical protein
MRPLARAVDQTDKEWCDIKVLIDTPRAKGIQEVFGGTLPAATRHAAENFVQLARRAVPALEGRADGRRVADPRVATPARGKTLSA